MKMFLRELLHGKLFWGTCNKKMVFVACRPDNGCVEGFPNGKRCFTRHGAENILGVLWATKNLGGAIPGWVYSGLTGRKILGGRLSGQKIIFRGLSGGKWFWVTYRV